MPLTRRNTGKRSSQGSTRSNRRGLKPVEKKQVKEIATSLDNKGKQVHEVVHVTPGASATGTLYANFGWSGIPTATSEMMALLPKIPQGDNREQRLGSKIKLKSNVTDFFFHMPPATDHTSVYSSVACRLLVMSPKIIAKQSTLYANWAGGEALNAKYLRDGSTETRFYGDLNSLRYPVNTALFRTHADKRFTLNRGLIVTEGAAGSANVPDSQKHIRISLKVKSKYLRFSDDGVVEADNFAPFALLLYAPCNGQMAAENVVHGNAFCHTTWDNLA